MICNIHIVYMDVSKNRGEMDGLFHGKPYEQMDDLGVPLFLETRIHIYIYIPGDSKLPFYPLLEGHLTFERVT